MHPQWLFTSGILIPLAISFSKGAILLLYRQIFSIHRKIRIAVNIGLVFNFMIYGVSLIIVPYFEAPHIGETFADLLINLRPAKIIVTGAEQGSLAVLLDLYIFILPIPALAGLKLPRDKKLKLLMIFGIAFL